MNFPIITDSYNFECTLCGNCCTGNQRVYLTPYDLYKIARAKNYKSTRTLFNKKIVRLVKAQNETWMPRIVFKAFKRTVFCPFLINDLTVSGKLLGKCALHPDKKPLICSLAPLGRLLDFEANSEQFVYVNPAPDCPGVYKPKQNRLRETINRLKQELGYEKSYLQLLDRLSPHQLSETFYQQNIFVFNTNTPFDELWSQITEKTLSIF